MFRIYNHSISQAYSPKHLSPRGGSSSACSLQNRQGVWCTDSCEFWQLLRTSGGGVGRQLCWVIIGYLGVPVECYDDIEICIQAQYLWNLSLKPSSPVGLTRSQLQHPTNLSACRPVAFCLDSSLQRCSHAC